MCHHRTCDVKTMCYIVFISHSLHWRYIKTALQDYVITNIIVTSLCITDMLTGFIAEPLYFTMNVLGTTRGFKKTVTVSTVVYFGAIYLITMSYVTQIVLWTERYIGIFQLYFYRKWCTKCFFAKFLVVLWIFFLIIHSATYFITSWDVLTYFALASFPIALSWCFYVQVKTFLFSKTN